MPRRRGLETSSARVRAARLANSSPMPGWRTPGHTGSIRSHWRRRYRVVERHRSSDHHRDGECQIEPLVVGESPAGRRDDPGDREGRRAADRGRRGLVVGRFGGDPGARGDRRRQVRERPEDGDPGPEAALPRQTWPHCRIGLRERKTGPCQRSVADGGASTSSRRDRVSGERNRCRPAAGQSPSGRSRATRPARRPGSWLTAVASADRPRGSSRRPAAVNATNLGTRMESTMTHAGRWSSRRPLAHAAGRTGDPPGHD